MNIQQEKNRLERKAEQMAIVGKIKKPIDLWNIYRKIAEAQNESELREVEKMIDKWGAK